MAKINIQKKTSSVENLKKSESLTKTIENVAAIQDEVLEEKKEETQKKINSTTKKKISFYITAEDYNEYKKFFGSYGFSFNRGLRMCMDFVKNEVEDGILTVSESGFRKTATSKFRQ